MRAPIKKKTAVTFLARKPQKAESVHSFFMNSARQVIRVPVREPSNGQLWKWGQKTGMNKRLGLTQASPAALLQLRGCYAASIKRWEQSQPQARIGATRNVALRERVSQVLGALQLQSKHVKRRPSKQ
jgi:hypothetical protein